MEKIRRDYPNIAPAGPNYTRGIRCGDMLFVSGCTAKGTSAQGAPLADQLRVTLDRITRIVADEGGEPGDIVKITTFVTSIANWDAYANAEVLFEEFFKGEYPTNSRVEITGLAEPGLDIEIDAMAILG